MHQDNAKLAKSLSRIGADMRAWDRQDTAVLGGLCTIIQDVLHRLSDPTSGLHGLLRLIETGLLTLQQQESAHGHQLVEAILMALATSEQCLLDEQAPDRALVVSGKSRDPQARLTEAGWLLEGALKSREAMATETRSATQSSAAVTEDLPSAALGHAVPQPLPSSLLAAQPPSAAQATKPFPVGTDYELLGEFITECREYITQAEMALLALEMNPEAQEAVHTVLRAFHTIKGTSAFLGVPLLTDLTHHAESFLSRIRERTIRCTGGYADLALRSVDMLKDLIQRLQDARGGGLVEPPGGFAELLQVLSDPEAAGLSEHDISTLSPPQLGDILVAQGKVTREDVEEAAAFPPRLGDILVAQGKVTREAVETAVAQQGPEPLGVALTRAGNVTLADVGQALRMQRQMARSEQLLEASVRVRVDRLDRLIDMVGELVIAHAMVGQDDVVLHGQHHEFLKKITQVGKIVRELQELSMAMRMVPLKATFQRMARAVRDVAQKSGKRLHFLTQGEDTEIDRNMVDVIAEPLVHMVRNAVDHGIETPDEREQMGKQRVGTVLLTAYHASSHVIIALQDDGRGLNRHKIVEKALVEKLIESDTGMSDNEVFQLIFEPGFSTVERLTDISGRGVGMDVVRHALEALQGHIDITSEIGRGTTFTVSLPLTLAMTDGMLVRVGQERFIFPTIDIAMIFRPAPHALCTVVGRGELVMWRDELLPLVRLHRLFDIPNVEEDPTQGVLVVVEDSDRHGAILVDQLLGQHQVVVKSLGAVVGQIPGISGAAILGDGRVGLILDPASIITLARGRDADGIKGPTSRSAA